GARDILEVERRVLPQQRPGEALQRTHCRLVRAVPILVVVGEREPRCRGGDGSLQPVEIGLFGGPDGVAARLRRPHHRHARVFVSLEGLERIDDEEKRGGQPLTSPATPCIRWRREGRRRRATHCRPWAAWRPCPWSPIARGRPCPA